MAKAKATMDPGADVDLENGKLAAGGKERDAAAADSRTDEAASAETPKGSKPTAKPKAKPKRLRQSKQPFCPYHRKVRCKAGRSDQFFTRYYCPEEGCTFSQKVPRPRRPEDVEAEQEDFSAR